MTEKEFSGKTALVTGGSRGIGRALSLKLARNGANVAINYLSRESDAQKTKRLIEKLGVGCVLVQANVSEPSEVQAMIEATRRAFGSIELLVANAAICIMESHQMISWETWKKTMCVNLDGPFLCIQAVKDEMLAKGYGRIVCISSIAGLVPKKLFIHYGASKAGLIAMVRCFSQALAPTIRVNCLAPGWIRTAWGKNTSPVWQQRAQEECLLNRWGTPEDVADVARFLVSPAAEFVTGQVVEVNGGRG